MFYSTSKYISPAFFCTSRAFLLTEISNRFETTAQHALPFMFDALAEHGGKVGIGESPIYNLRLRAATQWH